MIALHSALISALQASTANSDNPGSAQEQMRDAIAPRSLPHYSVVTIESEIKHLVCVSMPK
jgi:hypothetical protein